MNSIKNLALALVFSAGFPVAMAQDAAGPKPVEVAPVVPAADSIEDEARAMLEAYRAAAAEITDVACKVVLRSSYAAKEMEVTTHLTLAIEPGARVNALKRYRFTQLDEDKQPAVEWASDGEQVQKLDFRTKKLLSCTTGEATLPLEMFGLATRVLHELNPVIAAPTFSGITRLADAEAGGVRCNVIETSELVRLPDMAEPALFKTTRWIGAEDKGLRKLKLEYPIPNMEGKSTKTAHEEWECFDCSFNQNPPRDRFVLSRPEGFAAEEADAGSMGLAPRAGTGRPSGAKPLPRTPQR